MYHALGTFVFTAGLCLTTAVNSAKAESADVVHYSLYGGIQAGPSALVLPDVTYFGIRQRLAPFNWLGDLDVDANAAFGGTISAMFGMPLGLSIGSSEGIFVEVEAAFTKVHSDTSTTLFDDGTGTARYGFVQTGNTNGFGTRADTFLRTRVDRDAYLIELDALARARFSAFEIFAGPSFKQLQQDNDLFGSIETAGSPSTTVSALEDVAANYFGFTLGATGQHQIDDVWRFETEGRVSVYHADFDASVNETPQGVFVTALPSSLSLSDTAFAFGAKAEITVFRELSRGWQLGLSANVAFLSAAPSVQYNVAGTAPASQTPIIDTNALYSGGLRLEISRPF